MDDINFSHDISFFALRYIVTGIAIEITIEIKDGCVKEGYGKSKELWFLGLKPKNDMKDGANIKKQNKEYRQYKIIENVKKCRIIFVFDRSKDIMLNIIGKIMKGAKEISLFGWNQWQKLPIKVIAYSDIIR